MMAACALRHAWMAFRCRLRAWSRTEPQSPDDSRRRGFYSLATFAGITLRHQQESPLRNLARHKPNQRDRTGIVDPSRRPENSIGSDFTARIDHVIEIPHSGLLAPYESVHVARYRLASPDNGAPQVDGPGRGEMRVDTGERPQKQESLAKLPAECAPRFSSNNVAHDLTAVVDVLRENKKRRRRVFDQGRNSIALIPQESILEPFAHQGADHLPEAIHGRGAAAASAVSKCAQVQDVSIHFATEGVKIAISDLARADYLPGAIDAGGEAVDTTQRGVGCAHSSALRPDECQAFAGLRVRGVTDHRSRVVDIRGDQARMPRQ